MKRIGAVLVVMISALVGCAPADVSGTYSANLTNGENGCGFPNWTPGATMTNVPLTITQTEDAISGSVGGGAGLLLDIAFGGNVFTGKVSGSHIDMVLHGTVAQNQDGCAYTWDARIVGDLTGDALQGTITYTANTNTAPACSTLSMCQTLQTYSASRPPR